jgi:hypothetical protein
MDSRVAEEPGELGSAHRLIELIVARLYEKEQVSSCGNGDSTVNPDPGIAVCVAECRQHTKLNCFGSVTSVPTHMN